MKKSITINEIKNEAEFFEVENELFHIKKLETRYDRYGDEYYTGILEDYTGELPFVAFCFVDVNEGDFVEVSCEKNVYRSETKLKIEEIRRVREVTNSLKELLIPSSPMKGEKMFNEILRISLNTIKSKQLKKIIFAVYSENKEKLLVTAAGKSVHHSCRGGLLWHTLSMLKTARAVSSIYQEVNKDLLYAGVILHDVCKIKEFDTTPDGIVLNYSVDGQLLGHLSMGASYIAQICNKLEVSPETSRLLQHMMLSHHGKPEFGSPIAPLFLEAKLLNIIDNLDAQVQIYNKATSNVQEGGFSERIFALDNKSVYKPKYADLY